MHEVDKDVVGWRSNRCGRIAFRWPIKLSSRTRRTKWSVEKKWKRPGMRSAWKGERAASQFHTERGNGYDKWTRRCRCLYRQEKIRTFETLPILCAWCCFWQVLLCIRSRYIQNLTCTIPIWKYSFFLNVLKIRFMNFKCHEMDIFFNSIDRSYGSQCLRSNIVIIK